MTSGPVQWYSGPVESGRVRVDGLVGQCQWAARGVNSLSEVTQAAADCWTTEDGD